MSRDITVLWMDDREETYPGAETTVRDGVLHLFSYSGVTRTVLSEHHLPLCNIRDWYPAGQDGG